MNNYKIYIWLCLFITVYSIFMFLLSALYVNIRVKEIERQQERQLEINEHILNIIEAVRWNNTGKL